jgi:hypothetical protein
MKKIFEIDNRWFFKELPPFFKILLFFVRGDLLVLLPFLVVIGIVGIFSIKFMLIMFGLYVSIRYLGEMIYWFSHQFTERTYRPYDFGFKKLDNHAIYILYQTFAIVGTVIGISLIFWTMLYV